MNILLKVALSALLFSGLFFITGCGEKSASDQIEDAADATGDALENAADSVKDALN